MIATLYAFAVISGGDLNYEFTTLRYDFAPVATRTADRSRVAKPTPSTTANTTTKMAASRVRVLKRPRILRRLFRRRR